MRSGDALIRLAKHKVEGLQKLLTQAQTSRSDLEKQTNDLEAAAAAEAIKAQKSVTGAAAWAGYFQGLQVRRRNIASSIAGVERQISGLRDDLQLAFEELKRFELLEEKRKTREAVGLARREQAMLDEAATMRAARR